MKRTSAAALLNRGPLAAGLAGILPQTGLVLELGSGTGEHALHLARAFPALVFQPSDPDPAARASIAAWAEEAALPNLLPALDWDLRLDAWQRRPADAPCSAPPIPRWACARWRRSPTPRAGTGSRSRASSRSPRREICSSCSGARGPSRGRRTVRLPRGARLDWRYGPRSAYARGMTGGSA